MAMAVFSFFLFSAPLLFMIANPKPDTLKWSQNRSTLFRSMYERRKWAAELNERVQMVQFPKVSKEDHKSIENRDPALR